jgi:hypothetical protein
MKLFLCLSLLPLAIYLVAIGLINLRRRPLVMAGSQDVNLLGLALIGLAVAGPLELFLPETAAFRFGPWVWLLMLALYLLLVSLASMMMRPRLVIYNITPDELRPVLADVARRLDPATRWAGDGLAMPKLGVRLHMECTRAFRNVQLVSVGRDQDDAGWKRLELDLRKSLRSAATDRSPRGIQFLTVALLLAGIVTILVARDYHQISISLLEFLRM